jgi:hypothetical protein
VLFFGNKYQITIPDKIPAKIPDKIPDKILLSTLLGLRITHSNPPHTKSKFPPAIVIESNTWVPRIVIYDIELPNEPDCLVFNHAQYNFWTKPGHPNSKPKLGNPYSLEIDLMYMLGRLHNITDSKKISYLETPQQVKNALQRSIIPNNQRSILYLISLCLA